ncbi:MAG: hypothetical protein LBP74_00510 [Treponema sp.]|nr:hypothetical protein [Treponema sp.]
MRPSFPISRFLRFFPVLFFFCLSGFCWAQRQVEKPYWFFLEQGKRYFRDGEYGEALNFFEDARRRRLSMYARMERDMIDLLSISEVRRLGDDLEQVERYITDRHYVAAAAALEELYYRMPRESLGNSARRALDQFDRLKNYPEAEYWIGEIYRLEGEFPAALSQYQKALSQRSLLETPEFAVEILYKMADIYRLRQEYVEMEQRLLEIIEGAGPDGRPRNVLWSQEFVRTAMMRTLGNNGVDRFLTLYRFYNPLVERAHRLLGNFYYASGRHGPAAEHLLFAFLIQNSLIIDEVLKNTYDFTFTTLDKLMNELNRRPSLLAYLGEVEYYKTLYYLGSALYGINRLNPARELWTFVGSRPDAGEWRNRSALQLRRPFVERAVEMP